MTVLLEVEDLRTYFYTYEGVVKSLENLNFSIEHGEIYGLVGESGCGKSVAVRSIMRIIQPPGKIEAGKVWLHENTGGEREELLGLSEEQMQKIRGDKISMIFQEPNSALNPVLTIGEQIAESFLIHRRQELCNTVHHLLKEKETTFAPFSMVLEKIYAKAAHSPDNRMIRFFSGLPILKRWDFLLKREALARSAKVLKQLGLANPEELVRQYPHNLSGGMKQRVVIAIALACNPVLLIADEATSNLDVTVQAQILELLRELQEEELSSVLFISHDLGVVAETCDRMGVMYAGCLCESGPTAAVLAMPYHPYTQALLNSVPKFDQRQGLKSIEGSVPNLVQPPTGCRFHTRCPDVMEICPAVVPPLLEKENGRQVACHLYRKVGCENG